MPRTEARIKCRIWDDTDYTALPMDGQWLFKTLCSQKHMNHAGVVPIPRREWANLCSDDDAADRITVARKVLEERRYIVVDESTDEVLVRTMIRNDDVVTGPPGTFCAAMTAAMATVSPRLRAVLHAELLKIDRDYVATKKAARNQPLPLDVYDTALAALDPSGGPSGRVSQREETTLFHGMSNGMPDAITHATESHAMSDAMGHAPGEGVGEGEGGSSSCTEYSSNKTSSSNVADATVDQPPPDEPPAPEPRPDVDALCERLRDRIVANDLKAPTITEAWRKEARLMLDRDGRDQAQAMRLIDWCQADPFWHANILSIPKFRKKYDQLLAKARSEHRRASPTGRSSPTGSAAEATRAAFRTRREAPSNVHALPYANGI